MPLFVLQIAENGPASIDNRLRVSKIAYILSKKKNVLPGVQYKLNQVLD